MELLDKVQFSYDTSDQDVSDITDGEWQHKTWDLIFKTENEWIRFNRLIHGQYISQQLFKLQLSISWLLVRYQSSIDWYVSWYVCRLSVLWVTADNNIINQYSNNIWVILYRHSTDYCLCNGCVLATSINCYSSDISTKCLSIYQSTVSAGSTYSKYNPNEVWYLKNDVN